MPPRKSTAQAESPDPLLLQSHDGPQEIIAHPRPTTPIKMSTKRARAGTLNSVNPAQLGSPPSESPSKSRKGVAGGKHRNSSILIPAGSPTPRSDKEEGKTPVKHVYDSPIKTTTTATTTIADSAKKRLPTPRKPAPQSRIRPNTLPRTSGRGSLHDKSEIENESPSREKGGASSSSISRQAFLANEQLKRQREARNFKYEGDADAPRLTRSGKVVGEVVQDEYDVFDAEPTPEPPNEDPFMDTHVSAVDDDGAEETMEVDETFSGQAGPEKIMSKAVDPLPDYARPHILNILSTLTSTSIADKPKPFHDELQNDTLLSLTKLLQGTIDRSEGNSALLAGPRGSGKTRVSWIFYLAFLIWC